MFPVFRASRPAFVLQLCASVLLLTQPAWALEDGEESTPESVGGIVPVYYEGNPTCEDLGFARGFKPQDDGGDYDGGSGTFTFPGDVLGNSVWIDSDGTYVDWSSTIGIDAVIVKGGPNANSYVYDLSGEAYEDQGLAPPVNKDMPYGLSHVDFCYDYELDVSKTAETEYKRTWEWTIDKTSETVDLMLASGQSYMVDYEVSVSSTSYDSHWDVNGVITIVNPDPDYVAMIASVTDVVSGDIAAWVDCGVDFPYALGPGETLECSYLADLPNADCRVNTATVEVCEGSDVGGGSGTADVTFGEPNLLRDECVDVTDDVYGHLGRVCEDTTFGYCIDVGPYEECGDYVFENTASFQTCDLGVEGSDSHDVNVHIPCGCACTLTQGYWKTHSSYGPAPYDAAWETLTSGADTTFFKSGLTYYEMFWEAPAGNFYFNLAHQYAAAELNLLNGSMAPPTVKAAMNGAKMLFNAQGMGDTTFTAAEKKKAAAWTTTIDNYNNGLTGPGHCDE
jgi:hypothetical protein